MDEKEGGGGALLPSARMATMTTTTTTTTTIPSQLEDYYLEKIKQGNMPTVPEMQAFCSSRGLECPSVGQLRRLRYRWKVTAVLSGWKGTSRFMSSSIMKPGVVMIDLAYFMKQYLVANQQKKYFLVGVDLLTGRLFCVPTPNKKRASWEKAIMEMVQTNAGIGHIITDRDGAIVSLPFRKRIKREFGINWSFLMSRSHAFRAERMIYYLKRRLTQALKFNEKGDNCWIKHIPAILSEYNSKVIPGTTRPRDSVTKDNYMSMLQELRGSQDPTMLFNVATSNNFSPWLQQKLWNFAPGDRVLVARESDYEAKGQQTQKGGSFFKRSIEGSYSPVVRTVTRLWLKDSRFFITPVYSVSGLQGKFYQSELIPALFAERQRLPALSRDSDSDSGHVTEPATKPGEEKNVANASQIRTRSQRGLL
jgi:hypothetical protein